ncbi:MAG TPA: helix-turn-helix domain-containing protein [Candidatus Baltobacteraceae bacterium]
MPESQAFPSEIESFIAYCIDSVEQVEVLLLLAHAERSWTIAELSEHLRSSRRSVGLRLVSLVAHGLVARDGVSFRYAASSDDDALVKRLGTVYEERRSAVIDRIFSAKRDPLQHFADAFRLREDSTDG